MNDAPSNPLTPETFWGPEAGKAWRDALNALHRFAQSTRCLPGADVIEWFGGEHDAYCEAHRRAFLAGREGSSPSPSTQGE